MKSFEGIVTGVVLEQGNVLLNVRVPIMYPNEKLKGEELEKNKTDCLLYNQILERVHLGGCIFSQSIDEDDYNPKPEEKEQE